MDTRHPLLFDVDRWRSHRTWFLLPATVGVMVCVFSLVFTPQRAAVAIPYAVLGLLGYAMAVLYWLPLRLRWVGLRDGSLAVHSLRGRHQVPLERVRRARLARLRGIYDRPDRRRLITARARRLLLDREAVVLRLGDGDVGDLVAVRRVLGRRCVLGPDIVLPVEDAAALMSALERAMPSRSQPAPGRRRGAGRR